MHLARLGRHVDPFRRPVCLPLSSNSQNQRHPTICAFAVEPASRLGVPVQGDWHPDDYVEIGTLCRPHGVYGEMVVRVDTSFPKERFGNPGVRYLQVPERQGIVKQPEAPPRAVELRSGRQHILKGHEVWLVKLDGITSREQAAELRGFRLMVRADERPELEDEDEFYSTDLMGMEVVLSEEGHERDGIILGTVVDLHDGTGTYDVLRIEFDPDIVLGQDGVPTTIAELSQQAGYEGKHITRRAQSGLLPFAKEMVPEVNKCENCMEVCPPNGWLEMYLEPHVSDVKPRRTSTKAGKKSRLPREASSDSVLDSSEEDAAV